MARREAAARAIREQEEQARREQEERSRREREEQARRAEEEERARRAAVEQGAPDPEEARRLAEELERQDAEGRRRREEVEQLRERRTTPEGLAQVMFEAMRDLKGELFQACWLDAQDAQHLFGPRGREQTQLVQRACRAAWDAHRVQRVQDELKRSTFVRAEVPTRGGRHGAEVQGGQIVYRVDGEEKTIPLTHLYQVKDGSWKAARLLP
ncbi:MAG: hypothetical protein M9894_11690 [Planctomycetes bacterium]|nr:hypothetical protein [Planctomycetota bacterium]